MTFIPVGSEFQVNTYRTNTQFLPAIALDAKGNFVVAWASNLQDESNYGIFAQRYNSRGKALDDEFRVNTITFNAQIFPSVGMDNDGDFVVTWQSFSDGSDYGIFAQRYNSTGNKAGDPIPVNSFTTNEQVGAQVAMDADGDFVATWVSYGQDRGSRGIYAQRFNDNGSPAGAEFRVNQETLSSQNAPDIAVDPEGNFVVTWMSNAQDGSGYGIYARRYDASGSPRGGEFRVNSYTINDQQLPTIAMNAKGQYAIAWMSTDQDGDGTGIYAQRYNANGNRVGNEFRVNQGTTGAQERPAIAMDDRGDLLVTWQSEGQDGDGTGIYAKQIRKSDSRSPAQRPDILVNSTTTGSQTTPAIAMTSTGTFAIAWSGPESGTGNANGIFAQQFSGPSAVTFTKGTYRVGENGKAVGGAIKLTRSNTLIPATVRVLVKNGSAGRADYEDRDFPLDVTFRPGQANKTVKVPILQDTKVEGTETLRILVKPRSNAELGDRSKATLKIIDDDKRRSRTATDLSESRDRLLGLSSGEMLLGNGNEQPFQDESKPDRAPVSRASLASGTAPRTRDSFPDLEASLPFGESVNSLFKPDEPSWAIAAAPSDGPFA